MGPLLCGRYPSSPQGWTRSLQLRRHPQRSDAVPHLADNKGPAVGWRRAGIRVGVLSVRAVVRAVRRADRRDRRAGAPVHSSRCVGKAGRLHRARWSDGGSLAGRTRWQAHTRHGSDRLRRGAPARQPFPTSRNELHANHRAWSPPAGVRRASQPVRPAAVGRASAGRAIHDVDGRRRLVPPSVGIAIGDVRRVSDRAAVRAAARQAGADEFLTQLPRGLDTLLGTEIEGGADLSVGQWQRVAIARVLFRNASFIVLDEPTASLDAEAEAALFDVLQGLRAGRTIVLISHRFSTVRTADRIPVLHDGKLVEQGSHDELMARDGRYRPMYELQSRAYA